MKRTNKRKLSLNKETIRILASEEMGVVVGGAGPHS